jgi:hypothetical protein
MLKVIKSLKKQSSITVFASLKESNRLEQFFFHIINFFYRKGKCIFGLDPVSNGYAETPRHLTRCANPCPLSIQKWALT